MSKPLLGAHVSAAGGAYKAVENGTNLGAGVIQIFGASPRQWAARLPDPDAVERFKEDLRNSDIEAVYLHGSYLVNLATFKDDLFEKSVKNLIAHFQIANLLEADGLVFHIGANKDDKDKGIERIVEGMKQVLENVDGPSKLIMENSSGGGGKIGSEMEDLVRLHKLLDSPRVGFCFDTAHAFEAGVVDYSADGIKEYFDIWDKEIGLDNLLVFHANDSKTEAGSFSDRHENIGEGYIGKEGFENLAKEERLRNKPWILEVPGFDSEGPDKKNLDILKKCFSN